MYETHFGLREAPFSLTPNTHFYLDASTHRNAFETVRAALESMEGFIKVVGEVGTGKTLLCRRLLNFLNGDYVSAYIPNPRLSPQDLYLALADELQVNLGELNGGRHQLLKLINEQLIAHCAEGRRVVLVIDEAQAMPEQTIEALRLLTNLETESRKLLQVVLFGQPELDVMLSQPQLRQLKQRITFQEYIRPLDKYSVEQYIRHRLMAAGYNGDNLFRADAAKLIFRASGGVPRLVNVLAHKAMLAAYGDGDKTVAPGHVRRAVKDTESARPLRFAWLGGWA
ncbi:Type II secretory pathway, component ExeA (predicted ATPase) [Hahella chejuensis KCTC 2396]|uniref:Type II secretory pathway, component ExeA (Predicted ATPase) n=1 Tax=Hahella chejuensis (strain KCTC 2396) TaxID=349521 RepID=Q2S976_HAHCH|nr:AAA family ATPase [Hahella chejuensis]ABC32798.1 Type II secretory pathway, component ExeA (predicted ATPase) [Hahella chejuensis KCTC 2396]